MDGRIRLIVAKLWLFIGRVVVSSGVSFCAMIFPAKVRSPF